MARQICFFVFINLLHLQEYLVLANFVGNDLKKLIPKEIVDNEGLELFS